MIYFDNAATTRRKPKEILDAAQYYLTEIGVSPGRGSYQLGIKASRMLYNSRCTIGSFFGMTSPERVVFTKNSTEAINLLLNGMLKKGDHVLISCYEHNAVLRPLESLKRKEIIDYDIIERDDLSLPAEEIFSKYIKKNTRLFISTLASNLTGRIVFREEVFKFFHNKGILTFLDSSQGAGKIRISMKDQCIDFLAFTGHKDLLALTGVGGLCCESLESIKPLIQGGTGIYGHELVNPEIFPEGYEAGTLNMLAIWTLQQSIKYIIENQRIIQDTERELLDYFYVKIKKNSDICLYDELDNKVPIICINSRLFSSDKVIKYLDKNEICARGGMHCAVLAHEAIGTVKDGAVRFSLNFYNSKSEIDMVCNVLRKMGE